MKLTNASQYLLKFMKSNMVKNNCLANTKLTNKTKTILTQIHGDLVSAHKALHYLQKQHTNDTFYKMHITPIRNPSQIIKSSTFHSHYLPKEVRAYIDKHSVCTLTYTFAIPIQTQTVITFRQVTIHFTVEEKDIEAHLDQYNSYVEKIYVWLHIASRYAPAHCSKQVTLFFYFTPLGKQLPSSPVEVLDVIHVNTALTTSCAPSTEITLYRKEEWFKVLMHETFHNFGLDFSNMNNEECTLRMRKLFPVESEVNLYEAYCEFWAETMNVAFCSFYSLKKKQQNDVGEFIAKFDAFMHMEINYSLFQSVKILHFMGLTYEAMHSPSEYAKTLRTTLYKENTNVLSYYVIRMVLLTHYQQTLDWCNEHNDSLLEFKKTASNQRAFCDFIKQHYANKRTMNGIYCMQEVWRDLIIKYGAFTNANDNPKNKPNTSFIMNNTRMTLCELG
jgi:hypothetical protein